MKHTFGTRLELVEYIRKEFGQAATSDEAVAPMVGGRRAAEAALAAIRPSHYGTTRNYLDGAVTRLSPYIRHGILSTLEVGNAAAQKTGRSKSTNILIKELGWHEYFQAVYRVLGAAIWQDLEPYKTGHRSDAYATVLPEDIESGTTGLACIDAFSHDLRTTGYLHNHARMWLAAYVVHWRRVRWQAGARWFLRHLLDGDPASNNLSWQWVASTFSHKPYIFNRDNLERFTDGRYCSDCPLRGRCELDADYDVLEARLFPSTQQPDTSHAAHGSRELLANVVFPLYDTARAGLNSSGQAQLSPEPKHGGAGKHPLIWVHGDCLDPGHAMWQQYADAPAVWVWDDKLLEARQISLKRMVFIYESLLELPLSVRRGQVAKEVLRVAQEQGRDLVVTSDSPSPGFAVIRKHVSRHLPVVVLPRETLVAYAGELDLRRFSRFWRAAEHSIAIPSR